MATGSDRRSVGKKKNTPEDGKRMGDVEIAVRKWNKKEEIKNNGIICYVLKLSVKSENRKSENVKIQFVVT